MAVETSNQKLRIGQEPDISEIERQLKRHYGRGVFVDEHNESSDGTLFLQLGNASPKDVSDCRERDRALKFIEYNSIYTLEAQPVGSGYLIELPSRSEVYEGFIEQKQKLARRLDRSMALSIYSSLVGFTPVKNQLGAIESILRTVREEGPITLQTIHEIRGTTPKEMEKTNQYLRLLEDTDFIRIEIEGNKPRSSSSLENNVNYPTVDARNVETSVRSGVNLDTHDLNEIGTQGFDEYILGQVISEAYSTLRDELDLTLLAHYPKFANSYYFTPVERGDPDVRLDVDAAKENLRSLYGDDEHEITIRQKLDDLVEVDVVNKDEEGFYVSNDDVYEDVINKSAI